MALTEPRAAAMVRIMDVCDSIGPALGLVVVLMALADGYASIAIQNSMQDPAAAALEDLARKLRAISPPDGGH